MMFPDNAWLPQWEITGTMFQQNLDIYIFNAQGLQYSRRCALCISHTNSTNETHHQYKGETP